MKSLAPVAVALALPLAACGADGDDAAGRPRIVVTTSLLADVVGALLDDAADVSAVMPHGADPHEFQASAKEAAALREADLVVVNGAGFEEGLLEVIEGAEEDGVPVHEAIEGVDVLVRGEEDHAEDHDHPHDEGADPHFFTDPARMAVAAEGILDAVLDAVPELETEQVRARASAYVEELEALDAEVEALLAEIPAERRILVTNHDVLGYFADRYGFEVVGTVIPGGTTGHSAAGDLAALLEVIEAERVPAIFTDASAPADLARVLARDAGGVEVVPLDSESLGEGAETYVELVRSNARRIAEALR